MVTKDHSCSRRSSGHTPAIHPRCRDGPRLAQGPGDWLPSAAPAQRSPGLSRPLLPTPPAPLPAMRFPCSPRISAKQLPDSALPPKPRSSSGRPLPLGVGGRGQASSRLPTLSTCTGAKAGPQSISVALWPPGQVRRGFGAPLGWAETLTPALVKPAPPPGAALPARCLFPWAGAGTGTPKLDLPAGPHFAHR